jgi:sec-independent protein translocase protein TatA
MPGFIGFPELLLLGLVVLLVFGPKRLPEMGRSLGKGLREFKHSVTNDHSQHELELAPELAPELAREREIERVA